MSRSRLRLLLVEDDEVLLRVAHLTLERFGYRVASVTEPGRAVDLVRRGARFDVLVADVVLPGMGGRELLDALLPSCPGIKAVFISGHAEHLLPGSGTNWEQSSFLSKPYTAQELFRKIHEARAGAAPVKSGKRARSDAYRPEGQKGSTRSPP